MAQEPSIKDPLPRVETTTPDGFAARSEAPAGAPRGDDLLGEPSEARRGIVPVGARSERSERSALDEGELVGDKLLVAGEIGRGGMGRVLRVKDVDLNRDVAMKVLQGDADPRRFLEEAQITSQLDHPNVIPVHELGLGPDGALFFTMKFVRGHRTLRALIDALAAGDAATHAELSFERRVQLVQQVCDALDYAHQRGVIHRDLKPENVVVGRFGEVYLVDWGVAKLTEQGASAPEQAPSPGPAPGEEPVALVGELDRERTRDGQVVGTVAYMAPEQLLGRQEEVGPWSDVYSLCAVLYELLALHHYLDGTETGTYRQLVEAVVGHVPRVAESYASGPNGRVPRSLSKVCAKGLAKAPARRWTSARDLREALQAWLEGRSPAICPGTAIQRGLALYGRAIDRHPVALPALSLLLGGLVLVACLSSAWRLAAQLTGG